MYKLNNKGGPNKQWNGSSGSSGDERHHFRFVVRRLVAVRRRRLVGRDEEGRKDVLPGLADEEERQPEEVRVGDAAAPVVHVVLAVLGYRLLLAAAWRRCGQRPYLAQVVDLLAPARSVPARRR